MANVNKVTLIGYLGQDPKVSTTQQGIKVARISVGTTERGYTTRSGQQIPDKTEWHEVVLWRQSAEFVERYCKKGAQVFVQGKLRHRSYVDKDNQTKYVTEVEADDFQILDRVGQSSVQTQQTQQVVQQSAPSAIVAPAPREVPQNQFYGLPNDDEMPF